jgi:hypothetical protein
MSIEDDATACIYTTSFTITVLDPVDCFICETITNPSATQSLCPDADPSPFTVDTTFMGANAISYVYFTSQQTGNNMYTGGTLLGNVTPNGSLQVLYPML